MGVRGSDAELCSATLPVRPMRKPAHPLLSTSVPVTIRPSTTHDETLDPLEQAYGTGARMLSFSHEQCR